ncbi:MAG: glycosyltransferase family 39 protein, partial [bacterium]|nr:glycosyltransferase family 39 protein [bacterium]
MTLLIGVVCLWLAAAGSGGLLTPAFLRPMAWPLQFALFVAGVALVGRGLSKGKRHEFNHRGHRGHGEIGQKSLCSPCSLWLNRISTSTVIWPLLAIMLVGLLVRGWNLENAVHLFVDEMHFTNGVTGLWANPTQPLLVPMNAISAFPWYFSALQTVTVELFGASLTGSRMVSVLFGVLTIPAVYLLARVWFDRPTALLAAFVLAVFPPHVHFSRLALNNIADPLFGTLALALLGR